MLISKIIRLRMPESNIVVTKDLHTGEAPCDYRLF